LNTQLEILESMDKEDESYKRELEIMEELNQEKDS
jgi:hypothetical protein